MMRLSMLKQAAQVLTRLRLVQRVALSSVAATTPLMPSNTTTTDVAEKEQRVLMRRIEFGPQQQSQQQPTLTVSRDARALRVEWGSSLHDAGDGHEEGEEGRERRSPFMLGKLYTYDFRLEEEIERGILQRLHSQKSFEDAFNYWLTQVRRYQTDAGMSTLIEIALRSVNEHEQICRDRIKHIRRHCPDSVEPSDFVAQLTVSMLVCGFRQEAIDFAKLFSIPGASFIGPVMRMARRVGNTRTMDQPVSIRCLDDFAQLLEEAYFSELEVGRVKRRRRKQDKVEAVSEAAAQAIATAEGQDEDGRKDWLYYSHKFSFLLPVLGKRPPLTLAQRHAREKSFNRREEVRPHEVDVRKLEPLLHNFCAVWIKTAERLANKDSLLRFKEFARQHSLPTQLPGDLVDGGDGEGGGAASDDEVPDGVLHECDYDAFHEIGHTMETH